MQVPSPSLATRGESILDEFGWHNGSHDCRAGLRFRAASEFQSRRRADCFQSDRPRPRSIEVGDEFCQHAVPACAHAQELN